MVKFFKEYHTNITGLLLVLVILLDMDFMHLTTFDYVLLVVAAISAILNITFIVLKKGEK